jgi:hypothetical protein
MPLRRLFLPILILTGALFCLAACGGAPVRNLASDAAMIKAGETSRQELLQMLGQPDQRRAGNDREEILVYHEKETSRLKATPLVGRLLSPRREATLTVVIRDDVVFSARYGAIAYDEQRWSDDFKWQREGK